jgi:hypothetical protein
MNNLTKNLVNINNQIMIDYKKVVQNDGSIRNIQSFVQNINQIFLQTSQNLKNKIINVKNELTKLEDRLQYPEIRQQQNKLLIEFHILEKQETILQNRYMYIIGEIVDYNSSPYHNRYLYLVDKLECVQSKIDGRQLFRKYEVERQTIVLTNYLASPVDLKYAYDKGLVPTKPLVGFLKENEDPFRPSLVEAYQITSTGVSKVDTTKSVGKHERESDDYYSAGIWVIAKDTYVDFAGFNMKPNFKFNIGSNNLYQVFQKFSEQIKNVVRLNETFGQKIERIDYNKSEIDKTLAQIEKLLT